ncbi:MAG TPA: hypothetical protein VFX98_11735 [Longimicrobiaceae bacterium]|nr:hypothetical protein [Longimicrobiaceae bacterium]
MTALLIGLLAGAHTSSWGMYKDAPHEGFTIPKYLRSIVVAGLIAVALQWATGLALDTAAHAAVFFGMVYALERAAMELWKGFIREEDQSKYFIPMQFGVKGKPVQSRAVRWSVMVVLVAALSALVYGIFALQRADPGIPTWLVLLAFGSLGGWLSAFGGAWKDAPVEGFETLKFFRSPAIALFWSVVMAHFSDVWVYVGLAGIGYTVATIETYKTFFFPNKPRGKFAGKPVLFPEMLERRRRVVLPYAAIWAVVLTLIVLGLLGPRQGLL